MQTNCNAVVVLQQGEHSSVNNRPASKEVTGTIKKGVTEKLEKLKKKEKGSEGAVQKRSFNYFPPPRLKTYTFVCDGHTNRLIRLSRFQNLLWVYGTAWMSVRFPGNCGNCVPVQP